MNTRHGRLDEAIDHVAKRLTQVTDDDALATRILASLPDRSPWLLHSWIPRLAITAMLAAGVSFVVLRPFDGRSTNVLQTENSSAPFMEFRAAVERTSVESEPIVRRTTVERSQNDRRTSAESDHEYSLAAIDAPDALALRPVAPRDLASGAPLAVESLEIPDLPLTSEFISPR